MSTRFQLTKRAINEADWETIITEAHKMHQIQDIVRLILFTYPCFAETCDFLYKSKCFFLLMPASRVNRPEAKALCREKGGRLADIIDRTHFEKAQSLIRSKTYIAHYYNHIWTGMNVDIQVGILRRYSPNALLVGLQNGLYHGWE